MNMTQEKVMNLHLGISDQKNRFLMSLDST